MPGGRPTKYRDDMPEKVRALLSEGYSKAACAGSLGISYETFCVWERENPEFSESIKEGQSLSQLWWEDKGRKACSDPENDVFNPSTWMFNMKNRFPNDWRDRHEHTGAGGGPIKTESKVLQVVPVKPGETNADSDS